MPTDVVLLHPHTHAGRLRLPGERLRLDDDLARWLIDRGVARLAPDKPIRRAHRLPRKEQKS